MVEEHLNLFVERLATELGLQRPESDAMGHYEIRFDFRLAVQFMRLNERTALFRSVLHELGQTSSPDRDEISRALLEFALPRCLETPSVLAFDDDSDCLTLYQYVDFEKTEFDSVVNRLEAFINEVDLWRQFLSTRISPPSSSRPGGSDRFVVNP